MIRSLFLIFAFIVLIVSAGLALYQNKDILRRAKEDFGLKIETEEERKVLFCGEILVQGAIVRSQPKFGENIITCLDKEGNIVNCLDEGEMVKVYEVVEGDIYIFTRSVRGWTNNIWYKIRFWQESEEIEGFIYSSLLQEKPKNLCFD